MTRDTYVLTKNPELKRGHVCLPTDTNVYGEPTRGDIALGGRYMSLRGRCMHPLCDISDTLSLFRCYHIFPHFTTKIHISISGRHPQILYLKISATSPQNLQNFQRFFGSPTPALVRVYVILRMCM